MSDTFKTIEGTVKRFISSYPVSWIGRRPETWQEDKFPQIRQDFSDAIVKCEKLMVRLNAIGPLYKGYSDLQKTLLETKGTLRRTFERFEMWGLGEKGAHPGRQTAIYSKTWKRPAERVPEHLREK